MLAGAAGMEFQSTVRTNQGITQDNLAGLAIFRDDVTVAQHHQAVQLDIRHRRQRGDERVDTARVDSLRGRGAPGKLAHPCFIAGLASLSGLSGTIR